MVSRLRLLLALLFLAVLAGGSLLWVTRHPALPEASPPDSASLEPDLVAAGETLASVGGCASCHAAEDGALSGGRRLETPFGAIYSTNITPDAATGIGAWSEEAFRRAMRQGVARDGTHLYPAFPYDHFTKVSDQDIAAIYAWLMARPPVEVAPRPNELRFPYNLRPLMAGWNALFLDDGPFQPDPERGAAWNRGSYLVEGLGHCAACHSPRNRFGARDRGRDYSGGEAEGWHSPALDASSPAPVPWDAEALVNYLYDGWDADHGIAAGPMRVVTIGTSVLPEEDVTAIAEYLLSLREAAPDPQAAEAARAIAARVEFGGPETPDAADDPIGAAVFEQRCANCHRSGSESVPLALATAVAGSDPRNFVRITLKGVEPTPNAYFVRPMPGFPQFSDDELVGLANYARQRFTTSGPWSDIRPAIAAIR